MTEQSARPTESSAEGSALRRRRTRRFQERVAELRIEAIREAAGRVVARHGLAGATMDAIAEEAGVAKGTLYLYFKSREELIEKTADHALAALNRQVEAALAGPGGLAAQLAALVSAVLAFFDRNAAFFRLSLAVGEAGRRRGAERPIHPRFAEYLALLERWLADARSRRELALPPGLAAAAVAGAVGGALRHRFAAGDAAPPAADDAAALTDFLLHGLAGPDSRGEQR